ncbi:MAG: hypothetical protein ACI9G1_005275 [Pirellulaceae bacterium]|jgi:hypothetical protein
MRWTCLLLTIVALTGCQRMPRFDPLSGFGATRVSPPATNSYGVANRYYQRSPNEQSNVAPTSANPASVTFNQLNEPAGDPRWRPARESVEPIAATPRRQIATVSHEAAVYEPSIRIIEPSRPSQVNAGLNLKGIPISDATNAAQPGRFVPAGNVFAMPQHRRYENPSTGTVGSGQPTPATRSPGRIATQVSPDQSIWRSRYEH